MIFTKNIMNEMILNKKVIHEKNHQEKCFKLGRIFWYIEIIWTFDHTCIISSSVTGDILKRAI